MAKAAPNKSTLHQRNKHRERYDFDALIADCAELAPFVSLNKYGDKSIDFANPAAVKCLNKALLKHFYQIDFWDIPDGYLCPPIPGRADYIHYVADLLASVNQQAVPTGKKIKVLDVGIGANCVYPIIGHQSYGWSFVGSEVDQIAIRCAENMIAINASLKNAIQVRQQPSKFEIFKNIIHKEEKFDLTICNPPFHASAAEALAGSQRKVRNLSGKETAAPVLNFGGKATELWTRGGELGFIEQMISESKIYQHQCFWFTSLVAKSEHLPAIYAMLKRANANQVRTNDMVTGNKVTRIVAWTFLNETQQQSWVKSW